jgi:hypothetical protein
MSETDYVVATYREIALRFRLGSVRAARTKAQRARWRVEPPNHPADPRRIRVPRALWDNVDASGVENTDPSGIDADASEIEKADPSGIDTDVQGIAMVVVPDPPMIGGRSSRAQRRDAHRIKDLEAMVVVLREQLDRANERDEEYRAQITALIQQLAEARRPHWTEALIERAQALIRRARGGGG